MERRGNELISKSVYSLTRCTDLPCLRSTDQSSRKQFFRTTNPIYSIYIEHWPLDDDGQYHPYNTWKCDDLASGTNLYSQTTSFGETWLTQANKDSFSCWGASDFSYWDDDNRVEREVFRCQHENLIHTLSPMYFNGLIAVYNQGSGNAAYYFDIYNLMGDPSTDFVTRIPQATQIISSDSTTPTEQQFEVTVRVEGTGRVGALAAITMNGVLLGAAYTDANGVGMIHFTPSEPGAATLTVTGHNLIPNSKTITVNEPVCGTITLDKTGYNCHETITMTVSDPDLNTLPSMIETTTATISSTSEIIPETYILTQTGSDTALFTGTIQTSSTESSPGYLLLSHGDTITAHYHDLSCGSGSADDDDSVIADCLGPIISDVQVSEIHFDAVTISWNTQEPADSMVLYGDSTPPDILVSDSRMVNDHVVVLTGLAGCTDYVFKVIRTDAANNPSEDDNDGEYYSFETLSRVLLLDRNMDTNPFWTTSGEQWAWV